MRISFGAPRHHILYEDFIGDIERFLTDSALPAERLELRIPVKACFVRAPCDFNSLAKRGVQFVVDDLGRGMDWPLDWLSRAPMHGLQLDRSWVKAMQTDPHALKLCRAGLAIAKTFALMPIAASVDEPAQRDVLLALGCLQGSGDLYRDELIPPPDRVRRLPSRRGCPTAGAGHVHRREPPSYRGESRVQIGVMEDSLTRIDRRVVAELRGLPARGSTNLFVKLVGLFADQLHRDPVAAAKRPADIGRRRGRCHLSQVEIDRRQHWCRGVRARGWPDRKAVCRGRSRARPGVVRRTTGSSSDTPGGAGPLLSSARNQAAQDLFILFQGAGLGEHVIHARPQTDVAITAGIVCRERDDGDEAGRSSLLANHRRRREPVHSRHAQIHQYEIEVLRGIACDRCRLRH